MSNWRSTALLAGAALLAVGSAKAETPEQLDGLVDATKAEASGMILARSQADSAQWLEALASLDRVLALHPKSHAARLLQVEYLCRIDDRPGGIVALSKLKKKQHPKADWAATLAVCGVEGGK